MKIKVSKSFEITKNSRPYIIAEIGSNHNGDMKLCKKIIDSAKKAGVDCVKFQYFDEKTIFSKKTYEDNYFIADDYRNRTDFNLKQIVKKYSISIRELKEMQKYCKRINLDFLVTPFSYKESDEIEKLGVKTFKVASMDLNNYAFLEHIAKKNKTIILSTGLSNLSEIDKAVSTIENTGNKKLILLHCTSIYPLKSKDVNLKRIETLKKLYPYPIGFSDHTPGFEIALASVALGVCLIEKHFTLDKNMSGWDHHMSTDSTDMNNLVMSSKKVFSALGSNRILRVETKERVNSFRRSIVASKNIKKGEKFKKKNLDFKRPGTGLPPEKINDIVGKIAKRNITFDELIKKEDF